MEKFISNAKRIYKSCKTKMEGMKEVEKAVNLENEHRSIEDKLDVDEVFVELGIDEDTRDSYKLVKELEK